MSPQNLPRIFGKRQRSGTRSAPWKSRARRIVATTMALLIGITLVPLPASANPGFSGFEKTVVGVPSPLGPGDTFTYEIQVVCSNLNSDDGCVNTTVTDLLPEWIEYVGSTVTPTQSWSVTENEVSGRTELVYQFTNPLQAPAGATGLGVGDSATIQIQVRLAADTPYEISGQELLNVAQTEATNVPEGREDSAPVTPVIPLVLDASVSKSVSPQSAAAVPGTPVTFTLGAVNNSNTGVDRLTLLDPGSAPPLSLSNADSPFHFLEVTGFGAVNFPAPADQVQVSVYDDSLGEWITGPASGLPQLPPEVDPANIAGVNVSFLNSGGTEIPAGAEASVELQTAHRDNVTAVTGTVAVDNTLAARLDKGSSWIITAPTSAPHQILAYDLSISATKEYEPAQISAGDDVVTLLGATNTGSVNLGSLSITEPNPQWLSDGNENPFENGLSFIGFGSDGSGTGVQWPNGAQSAEVVFTYADGTTQSAATTTPDTLPQNPNSEGEVVGLEIIFQAGDGSILSGASAAVPFLSGTSAAAPVADYLALPNEILASGTDVDNPEASGSETAKDTLEVYGERIGLQVSKTLSPQEIIGVPGQRVVAQLPTTVRPFPHTTTNPTEVIVTDDTADWYDHFRPATLPQLGIPNNTNLSVEYFDGAAWVALPGATDIPHTASPFTYQVPNVIQANISGLRFIYSNETEGFSPGTTLFPNITFSKYGSVTEPVEVANCGVADASNALATAQQAAVTPPDCPVVELVSLDGSGPDILDKEWADDQVTERTGQRPVANLRWSTGGFTGLSSFAVVDTGRSSGNIATPVSNDTELAASAFDLVNLTQVGPITPQGDPLIRYDQIAAVELFNYQTQQWEPIAASSGPWNGSLPALQLNPTEQATTVAVRLTIAENPNRTALAAGDPFAPQAGDGIAASAGNGRIIPLTFQLRDTRRSDTSAPILHDVSPITNGAAAQACFGPGDCLPTSQDTSVLPVLDSDAELHTSKTWTGGPVAIPPVGTPIQDFPSGRVTVVARNDGPVTVNHIEVVDPAPGGVSPFDEFDLLDIVNITPNVGSNGITAISVVLEYSSAAAANAACPTAADGVNCTFTRAQALNLSAAELGEAVGVKVLASGRIPTGTALTVTTDLRLRANSRSSGEPVTVAISPAENSMRGILRDPAIDTAGCIERPEVPAGEKWCEETANLPIVAELDRAVSVSKSFSPAHQFEDQTDLLVTTLSGQPSGPARTNQMVLRDDEPRFWNAFNFAGLPSSFSLASPVNRVQIEVMTDATWALSGTPGSSSLTLSDPVWQPMSNSAGTQVWFSAADARTLLPQGVNGTVNTPTGPVPYNEVRGVRFTFQRVASAAIGNASAPLLIWENPANPVVNASFAVQRRADLRVPFPDQSPEVPSTLTGQIAAPGETVIGTVTNNVAAVVSGPFGQDADDVNTASYEQRHRHTSVILTKTPTGNQPPGQIFNGGNGVTLRANNDGNWPIIDPVLFECLPTDLSGAQIIANPDLPLSEVFTFTLNGNPIPAGDVTIREANTVDCPNPANSAGWVFEFPAGFEIPVGQTLEVRGQLMFRPGLLSHQQVTNQLSITGQRDFDRCNSANPADPTRCNTSATLTVTPAANLFNFKAVKGHDTLGFKTQNATLTCDQDGFNRFPCVVRTVPGSRETWQLNFENRGTYPLDRVVAIDMLPQVNDRSLLLSGGRGSTWDPVLPENFLDSITVTGAGAGADLSVFYSTVAPNAIPGSPCTTDHVQRRSVGQAGCEDWNWQPLTPDTDLDTIVTLKFELDFSGEAFDPAEKFAIEFDTLTPFFANITEADPVAWNSLVAGAGYLDGATQRATQVAETTRVGVALATGDLQLQKTVLDDTDYSAVIPSTFPGVLSCQTPDGEGIPADTLTAVSPLVQGAAAITVTNLPWGLLCTFLEDSAGETTAEITAAPEVATLPGYVRVTDDPTEVGLVHITNHYEATDLEITKFVASDDPDYEYDTTFQYTLSCSFNGSALDLPAAQTAWSPANPISITGLPTGTICEFLELDANGADLAFTSISHGVTGADPEVSEGKSLTFTVGSEPGTTDYAVEVTNDFTSVPVTITKEITGAGAALWGAGPFEVTAQCTNPLTIPSTFTLTAELSASDLVAELPIPLGSDCAFTETEVGAANSSVAIPANLTIGATDNAVTVTNTFTTTSLEVTKEVSGAPAAALSPAVDYEYEVTLSCTREVNGEVETITIPGGAVRTLTVASPASYANLPVGADCVVTETDAGYAQDSEVDRSSVELSAIATNNDVVVTNTFDSTNLEFRKEVTGPGAHYAPDTFNFTYSCTWHGVPVPLVDPTFELGAGEVFTTEDLPIGTICVITEQDHGQNLTTGTASWQVTAAATTEEVALTNQYDLADLVVGKETAQPEGTAVPTGFGFHVVCVWQGETILDEQFILSGGAQREFADLPARADCTVTETETRGAGATTIDVVQPNSTEPVVVDDEALSVNFAELVPGGELSNNEVTFTNLFEVGGLQLRKEFAGGGAAQFGLNQTYELHVVCVHPDDAELLLNTTVELFAANNWTAHLNGIVDGALCQVTEPDLNGADAVVFEPVVGEEVTRAEITVSQDEIAQVTATNWFLTGSVEVTKQVTGAGGDLFGDTDFTLDLSCVRDGVAVQIPDGAQRTVSAADPVAVWSQLPTGADCVLTELRHGGATESTIQLTSAQSDGTDEIENGEVGEDAAPAAVPAADGFSFAVTTDSTVLSEGDQPQPGLTVTNRFDLTEVSVTKNVAFVGYLEGERPQLPSFQVTLACTLDNGDGTTREVRAAQPAAAEISADETVTWDHLPVGADCVLTETETGGAQTTAFHVAGRDPEVGSQVTLNLAAGDGPSGASADIQLTNTFRIPEPETSDQGTGTEPLPVTGLDAGRYGLLAAALIGLGACAVKIRRNLRRATP